MKFRFLLEDYKGIKVWVGLEGSGDMNDEHKIFGVSIRYDNPLNMIKGHSIGEDPMQYPII